MAGLKEQVKSQSADSLTTDGKTAQESYRMVSAEAHSHRHRAVQVTSTTVILPALAEARNTLPAPLKMERSTTRVDTPAISSAKWCRS
jgi:hypothetical protein